MSDGGAKGTFDDSALTEALRTHLAAIIESSDDAIISKTLDGVIVTWNAGAERMFGYSRAEAVGRPVSMLLPEDRQHEEEEILARLRLGERIEHFETVRLRKDGRPLTVSLTVSPVNDAQGNIVGASKIARDISARKLAEELHERLAGVVESSEDAIVSKTLEGIITTWNAGAEQVFGYTAAEAVGRPVTILFPPELLHEEDSILSRIRRGERIEHYETVRLHKDGRRLDVSLSVSPVKDSTGKIVGAAKIARDITQAKSWERERESLLAAERAARAESERISLMKDEFLATLSHELRTPLNAILGWSQLLCFDDATEEDLRLGLDAIQRNARAQTQLIEDLLDMSRIISGKIRLEVQSTELPVVIEAAADAVRPSAEAKQIRLRTIMDPAAGPVMGDPTRLQQVVWNLLSNAIKFTPKEGTVDVILERTSSHLTLTVRDSGAGIRAELLPQVFERFRQGDSSTTRAHGGLGLGLSIVKSLVELHGGTVEAASAGEGQGATFIVTLPLAPVRAMVQRRPTGQQGPDNDIERYQLEGVKVLVVDDEVDARELIKRVLSQNMADVFTASGAVEAIEVLQSARPHVVVSDIGMPGTDGYQFIRQLRSLPADEGGRTPAIALTAFARTEDRTRAMMAGYQVHMAKPIDAAELLATVGSLARWRRG
jgi:PAS domain S-box-containing protein